MAYKETSQVPVIGELGINTMYRSLGTTCSSNVVILASSSFCSFLTFCYIGGGVHILCSPSFGQCHADQVVVSQSVVLLFVDNIV